MTTTIKTKEEIATYLAAKFPAAAPALREKMAESLRKGESEICPTCTMLMDAGGECEYCYAAALEAEANSKGDDDYNRHATLYPQF